MKSKIALYWLTAARAGFAKPSDWRSWADQIIVSISDPPIWIIDISLALKTSDLSAILKEMFDVSHKLNLAAIDDALIGYIWWRFEKHELGLRECLKLIGEAADTGSPNISCEQVYTLLTDLELGKGNEREIESRAKKLMAPLRRVSEQQWNEIQSYTFKRGQTK